MKLLQRVLLFVLFGLCTPLLADEPASHDPGMTTKLVGLLQSATVNSTSWAGNDATWDSMMMDRHLQANFTSPVSARVIGADGKSSSTITFKDLLLPLPEKSNPAHILVRSAGKVLAFTKFSPDSLAKVVCDPSIDLSGEERYAGYCHQFAANKP